VSAADSFNVRQSKAILARSPERVGKADQVEPITLREALVDFLYPPILYTDGKI
jgi:hypothetical protein